MANTNQMQNIFLCGSYHGNNFGDLAILESFLKKLPKKANIRILSQNPELVASKLDLSTFPNITFIGARKILTILKSLKWADKLIIGGGGLFFDYSFFDTVIMIKKSQLLFWVLITVISRVLKKEVVWTGVGIGPINSNFGKIILKIGLKFANLVIVRDKKSLHYLEDTFNYTKAQLSADIVFSNYDSDALKKLHTNQSIDPTEQISVGLVLLADKSKEAQIKKLLCVMKERYKNWNLILFATNPNQDNDFIRKIAEEYDIKMIDTSKLSLTEFRALFGQFQIIISMRMHALLFAFQNGAIGLGVNIEKCREMQKQIYGENLYVESIDFNAIDKKIDYILNHQNQLRINGLNNCQDLQVLSAINLSK